MNKLLVVDGTNLLFQMFFGMPNKFTHANGKGIWGVVGFVGALRKIISLVQPTHVVAIFDGEHCNPRCQVDQNYKANRVDYSTVEDSENPFSQLDDVYKALGAMGIATFETTTCETDDVVASYAKQLGKQMQIVVCSFDSDFFQLVTDNVCVLRYRGKQSQFFGIKEVQQRFGVHPQQYAHFKCLVGDSADNIRGIRGIGPKRASQLLSTFGTLQNIVENAHKIANSALRGAILQGQEQLQTNLQLVELHGDEQLPFAIDQLVYTPSNKTTTQILQEIM